MKKNLLRTTNLNYYFSSREALLASLRSALIVFILSFCVISAFGLPYKHVYAGEPAARRLETLQGQVNITGIVTDDAGRPVIGATIAVKGTTMGTITAVDGSFSLTVPGTGQTLVVSFIGYRTQEIDITSQSDITVTLKEDVLGIDEVMVVAYGTTKKSSFTGSASVVGAKSIESRPITSVTSAIEGNASGVQVTSGLGQPGESASIMIRGFGSANASNAPLYIVDGAIFDGNISNLNPSDIESITILKDAASTSLYGSSAGNGVVLITTKKGSEGASVNVSITQGWSSRAYKDYATVNVWEYYPLQWEMRKNAYISAGNDEATAASQASSTIVSTLKYNPYKGITDGEVVGTDGTLNTKATQLKWGGDLDWEDAAFGNGYRQEYVLSYSTKADKSDTYASLAYLNDKGYMLKTDFERYSARINYNIAPLKWFKSGINLAMSRTLSNFSRASSGSSGTFSNLTRAVRMVAPIYPLHKHDLETGEYLNAQGNPTTAPAEYIYDYDGAKLSDPGRHVIAETKWNKREISNVNSMGRAYVTLIPLEGLSGTVNYSYENSELRRKVYENPYVGDGTAGPGRLTSLLTRSTTETFNQLVNYTRTANKHTFDVLAGHENYSYKYEYAYTMKVEEIVEGVYDLDNFVTTSSNSSYTDQYRKEGYLARVNYDYDGKYYLSASFRHDGSSRFSKDSRWGNFWSFGASWRMSEEQFMKNAGWVNNLKLRASYGETGNDAVLDSDGYASYYPHLALYRLGMNNGTEKGAYFYQVPNPNLQWETQVSTDVAIEFGLFDRLFGTIEFFSKASKDLLFDVSMPTSIGVSSLTRNLGKMRNRGVEVELDYTFVKTRDWKASVGVNATFLSNKIVRLPDENRENGIIKDSKKLAEGKSRYTFWLRQWYGVNPDNGDGLYYFDPDSRNNKNASDLAKIEASLVEKDGKALTNSYVYAKYDYSGTATPDIYGGFNLNIEYKGLSLGAVFSYTLGGKILNNTGYGSLMDNSKFGYAMHEDVKKAWKKAGDITDVPRLDANSTHATSVGQSYSTRWLVSADYLNLRAINLGYIIPRKYLDAVLLTEGRITFSAENLFMVKARQGLNPQANYTGVAYNEYMPARTFTLGVNLSF